MDTHTGNVICVTFAGRAAEAADQGGHESSAPPAGFGGNMKKVCSNKHFYVEMGLEMAGNISAHFTIPIHSQRYFHSIIPFCSEDFHIPTFYRAAGARCLDKLPVMLAEKILEAVWSLE